MFTFSVTAVRAVIMRGRIDAFLNGGFRNPHYGLAPGKDEKPGVWLVGDEGVYVMSNGKLAEGQRPFVVYAEKCDPKTNPDYWHDKRQHFGGDDGINFLDAEMLVKLIAAAPAATQPHDRDDRRQHVDHAGPPLTSRAARPVPATSRDRRTRRSSPAARWRAPSPQETSRWRTTIRPLLRSWPWHRRLRASLRRAHRERLVAGCLGGDLRHDPATRRVP